MGAGMVHPKVLKESGIDPTMYSGFAFGMGIDRLGFMKYEFDDVRSLYNGDLRFINQF
jgi:phenylalanyl-tRNA synthetase alpha chain